MLLKQTYWHRGLRWRTWCTEVGKLPESKNLTVLYHLIMGNYYLVKKKKKFLCKCADREQEQLRLSVPLKGKHYLCSKCFTRQTRCSLKGGYLGVHFESKALGPQPGSPALNSTKITLQQSSSNWHQLRAQLYIFRKKIKFTSTQQKGNSQSCLLCCLLEGGNTGLCYTCYRLLFRSPCA